MSKHSPGPWRLDVDNLNVYSSGMVAQTYGHVHNGERAANARLIAAAPELLEALRICQQQLLDKVPYFTNAERDTINSAIAKAECK